MQQKTYISVGDFIDLFYKIKEKGYAKLFSKLRFTEQARTVSKWNNITVSSDFWIIPQVRKRWNEKCTGNPNLEYEDYVMQKHFSQAKNLRMLSVGCGEGARERKFAEYDNFAIIEGIDIAPNLIQLSRELAEKQKLSNIQYYVADFEQFKFEQNAYDIILFNSSLHHFDSIYQLLKTKIKPLLKENGHLIIHEYVGPNRLQWTKLQLDFSNKLLQKIPNKFRIRRNSNSVKSKIYRPGLFRMLAIDPSEAIDSKSIIPSIHKLFSTVEEENLGWNITHLLLKDIAHNFLDDNKETNEVLSYIFDQEDEFLKINAESDAVFGIYKKRDAI